MSDFAQEVKQRTDIVKVIGGYIRLRKAGAQNYSGLCPFHKEKSPSFSVHAGRQFFHCFGCGVSGDVFSFVGKIENLSFPEAVRVVAQKSGIPLPKKEYSSPEEAAEAGLRRKLLDLHEAAAVWFQEQLRSPEGALARARLDQVEVLGSQHGAEGYRLLFSHGGQRYICAARVPAGGAPLGLAVPRDPDHAAGHRAVIEEVWSRGASWSWLAGAQAFRLESA